MSKQTLHAARFALVALLALGLTVVACEPAEEEALEEAADTAAEAPAPMMLGDAEIAHVAVTANAIDSAAGELAKTRAQDADVKAFAETMITDHTAVNKQAGELAGRLALTPADNPTSQGLQSAADAATQRLSGLSGAEFDRAYIDNEVTYHQNVLDALDQTLIPGAQNIELRQLLQNVRPAVSAHLDRARQIQTRLSGAAPVT